MKTITLTQGYEAIVDDEDYDALVALGRWCVDFRDARRYAGKRLNGKTIMMHRHLMDYPQGLDVDHINGNGLDNRRSNLRAVSRGENNHNNFNPRIDNKSGFRGVYWDTTHQRWKAEIKWNGRKYHLGSFTNAVSAGTARKTAEARIKQGLLPR